MFGLMRPEPAPDIRWRGNQKQQFKAAEIRARKNGHAVTTTYIQYGPIGTTDRYVLRCTCGEHERFPTENHRIVAERAHIMQAGRKK